MTNFSYFTPYNESPTRSRTSVSSTDSGSNTTSIDAYRQGVEVITDAQRFNGVLPKLGTGNATNEIEMCTFGQPNEFTFSSHFEEIGKFNAVAILLNSSSLTYPVVLDSPAYESPEQAGGYIQPLSIPSRDSLLSNAEFEPHDIRGNIMCGNENSFKSVDLIVDRIRCASVGQIHDLYIDAADSIGTQSGSVLLQGLFPESEKTIDRFAESTYVTRNMLSSSSISSDIRYALSSRSIDSEIFISDGYKMSGTGFTYENSLYGVDSIAFGGLKRS